MIYGSDPQGRRVRFRTFRISPEFRERYGYPELTPALRAKIFGLNGAKVYGISADELKRVLSRDRISSERTAYAERPDPHFLTYGPKTRREFLRLSRLTSGRQPLCRSSSASRNASAASAPPMT